jgi:hypothetical protein
MARKKKVVSPFSHLYCYEQTYTTSEGRLIESGEIIKIRGIWGVKFKFVRHVQRTDDNTKEWIDCYELEKGVTCGLRSFYPERIKPLSKKRNKKKTV